MQHKALRLLRSVGSLCSSGPRLLERQQGGGTPVAACPSVQIFALQPHLHIELEVIFLCIRANGIVDFKDGRRVDHVRMVARAKSDDARLALRLER